MSITCVIKLRPVGPNYIVILPTHKDLVEVLNSGFYEGDQLTSIATDVAGFSLTYNFHAKEWIAPSPARIPERKI
jgi:hypothetical protein